jgi:predicted small lipoprotein YifL
MGPVVLFLLLGSSAACGSKQPVPYPNDHLTNVGQEVAQADIAACMQRAREYGVATDTARRTTTQTATGAAVGGATGSAVGAVTGHPGRGAAAGAAGGATAGFMRSLFGARDPDPLFRSFVETCLRERGYETIGWR